MNLFKTKFDAATIVLIPACIGINYLGKMFASLLKLPLWLDSIGTCIGGCLGGPIIGGICGAANNLIYGLTAGDNITLIYALTSLGIGLAAAAFTFAVGGGLGILAGFAGGWADALISFLIQVLLAIPQLPVMIVIGAFLGQSTWNLVWIIAAFSWAPVARQMRAKTISIRRRDYVQMARLYGGGTWYLIRTHIGHELWPLLTINALAVVGRAILQESSLAFLGLSDPLARSWGMMIARAVDFPGLYRTDFWTWWLLPPVGALVLSTLLLRLLVGGLEEQQRRDKPCCWK